MEIKTNQTKQFASPQKGAMIDGVMRVSRGTALRPLTALSKSAVTSSQSHTTKTHTSPMSAKSIRKPHISAMSVKPHAPQKATTLMRSAVKKPVIKSAAVIKAQTRTDLLANAPMQTVAPKMSFSAVNPTRRRHAERMVKSPAVTRYAALSSTVQASSFALTPTHHPQQARPAAQPAAPIRPATPVQSTPQYRPGMSDLRPISSRPVAVQPATKHTVSLRPSHAAHGAKKPTSKHDIFDEAIARSISHEQTYDRKPARAKKRGHFFRFATATVVVLAAIGVAGYHNASSLSLKVASYRAGLHATLPARQPAGFNLGYLDYQPGNITANFTSPNDGRQYNITQKASSWDSQALLSNFVASANSAYKTYQRAGRTVYVLGNNTATWVDSGIWYTVDGNASLTSQQLLDLAGSM